MDVSLLDLEHCHNYRDPLDHGYGRSTFRFSVDSFSVDSGIIDSNPPCFTDSMIEILNRETIKVGWHEVHSVYLLSPGLLES